jgi:hypothetical protein
MRSTRLGCRAATLLGVVAVATAVMLTVAALHTSPNHHRAGRGAAHRHVVRALAPTTTPTTRQQTEALAVPGATTTTTTGTSTPCPVQPLQGDGTWPVVDGSTTATAPSCGLLTDTGVPSLTQWITTAPTTGCTWTTFSSASASPSSVIASWSGNGQAIMAFPDDVAAVRTEGCGTWVPWPASDSYWLIKPSPSTSPFGDGTYPFWLGISDGTWQASGGPDCHWAVLRDFTGRSTDVVSSGTSSGPTTVTMAVLTPGEQVGDNDGGFTSQGCGTWTYVGGGSL